MKKLEKYILRGLLKKVRPNFEQIDEQIQRAYRDIETAKMIRNEDPLWATTIIYQSLLRAARALLYSYGYLTIDGAQHKTAVEVTGALLGADFEEDVLLFNKLRKERNLFFYESEGYENEEDVDVALNVASKLFPEIKKHIERNNPQGTIL